MTVPRAVACPRWWFPPATFQLRLRSLRTIFYMASTTPRNGHEHGYFYICLHDTVEGPVVWTGSKQKWNNDKEERLEWSDIEVDPTRINLGMKSIVVKVWFVSSLDDSPTLDTVWGLYFTGLRCLGTHPPNHGRLPPNALIFQICGSFFSSASHIRDMDSSGGKYFIPRYLHIGTLEEYQTVKSYDTTLLSKLHMTQRALKQQDANNTRLVADLKDRGVDRTVVTCEEALSVPNGLKPMLDVPSVHPGSLPSLRKSIFARRFKHPKTRLAEQDLLARIELLRLRIILLQKERDRRRQDVDNILLEHKSLALQIEEKTSNQMHGYHNLAKEKAGFHTWMEKFNTDLVTIDSLHSVLRQERLSIVHNLLDVFPIGDLEGKRPTLLWTTLPPTDEIKESIRDESQISVVVGDVAQLIYVIARILDVPLRYPMHLMGSTTSILDEIKVFPEHEIKRDCGFAAGEFPLHLKSLSSSEWSKFEYGLYLLNKNLAQLMWHCCRKRTDLRFTLHTLYEMLVLGQDSPRCRMDNLATILTVSTPPASFKAVPQVIIKNGRVTNPMAIVADRKGSQSSEAGGPMISMSNPSTPDVEREEPQFCMDDHQILSSSVTSNSSGVPESPPRISICEEEDAPTANILVDEEAESRSSPETSQNLLWDDVTLRTKALSNPSSFQRPRTHHY